MSPLLPAVVARHLSTRARTGLVTSREDGFRANYPGQPKVEATTHTTEFRITLPARVYRARTRWAVIPPLSSTTATSSACTTSAPRNERQRRELPGRRRLPERLRSTLRGDGSRRVEFLKRDGIKVTRMASLVELVTG
jgi:hypothetical protein